MTVVAICFVDRVGRKPLLLLSLLGIAAGLVVLIVAFSLPHSPFSTWLALAGQILYIVAFAPGLFSCALSPTLSHTLLHSELSLSLSLSLSLMCVLACGFAFSSAVFVCLTASPLSPGDGALFSRCLLPSLHVFVSLCFFLSLVSPVDIRLRAIAPFSFPRAFIRMCAWFSYGCALLVGGLHASLSLSLLFFLSLSLLLFLSPTVSLSNSFSRPTVRILVLLPPLLSGRHGTDAVDSER
jgi:MFS family permease